MLVLAVLKEKLLLVISRKKNYLNSHINIISSQMHKQQKKHIMLFKL